MPVQTKPNISIIVPVYNSAGCLSVLVEQLHKFVLPLAAQSEIIFINDGSVDASWNTIVALAEQYPAVRGINMMRNYGQHNALLCGIRLARYEVCMTMDDDLQHPANEAYKLVDKLLGEGLEVVYGRPIKEEHGLLRDIASVLTKFVMKKALGAKTAPDVSAFRVFRTKVRNSFSQYNSPFVNIDVLLTWGASKFGSVFVEHKPGTHRVSNYTLQKLITHAVNMLTGFSTVPLQMASLNGLICILLGIVLLAYVLIRYMIWGGVVPGFSFLSSIIIIFSGSQLMALGIIGEYVGRIYARSSDRPSYQVDETVQCPRLSAVNELEESLRKS
jgi:glycosyltransferase involved in cell wall biosynthesis